MYVTEVGQALLERHEAYVRRHEVCSCTSFILGILSNSLWVPKSGRPDDAKSSGLTLERRAARRATTQVDVRVAELVREVCNKFCIVCIFGVD